MTDSQQITQTLSYTMHAKTTPTIVNKYIPQSWVLSSSKQTWLVWGICRNEDLKSAVVVGLPIIIGRVSSTEDDWIFGWLSRLASLILILCSPFTLFHCGWMKRLFGTGTPWIQFLQIKCWRWRIWIYKTFPEIFHVCPKCLAALLCGSAFQ